MKIAILGTGNIGSTLGKKWAAAGHAVVFGARDPASPKTRAALERAPQAAAQTIDAALVAAAVVVFAIPGAAMDAMVAEHADALDGKILVDTTNQFGAAEISAVRALTAWAPRAQVFRAFNSLGWENFENPRFGDVQVDLLYCGPDGDARRAVEALIGDVGLRPVYVGGLDQAHLVDNLGALWAQLAFRRGMGRRLAYKVLTEGGP